MRKLKLAISLLVAALLTGLPAIAQEGVGTLSGQTIELLTGNSDGSTINTVWQLFAESAQRLHPDLRIVVRPNAGGSAALAATLIAEAAPDGHTIGTVDMDTLIGKANGDVAYAVTDFAVLGSLQRDIDVLLATVQSGITSIEQLVSLGEPAILPVRSTTSGTYYQTQMINAYLGTRIRAVTGYDSGARALAFASGEAQVGLLGTATSTQVLNDGVAISLLKLIDLSLPPEYRDPPAISQFAGDPRFTWVPDYLNAAARNLILVTRKDVPPVRVAALRDLFMEVGGDSDFQASIAAVARPDPASGEEIESLLASITAGGDFAERLSGVVACGIAVAETGNCN